VFNEWRADILYTRRSLFSRSVAGEAGEHAAVVVFEIAVAGDVIHPLV